MCCHQKARKPPSPAPGSSSICLPRMESSLLASTALIYRIAKNAPTALTRKQANAAAALAYHPCRARASPLRCSSMEQSLPAKRW